MKETRKATKLEPRGVREYALLLEDGSEHLVIVPEGLNLQGRIAHIRHDMQDNGIELTDPMPYGIAFFIQA